MSVRILGREMSRHDDDGITTYSLTLDGWQFSVRLAANYPSGQIRAREPSGEHLCNCWLPRDEGESKEEWSSWAATEIEGRLRAMHAGLGKVLDVEVSP